MQISVWDRRRLLLLIAICTLVIGLRLFWATPIQARWFVQYCGYFSLLLCSLILVVAFCRSWRECYTLDVGVLRRHRFGLIAVMALSVLTHIHEPHRFKVMNDEYALTAASRMMHEYREACVPGYVHCYDGQMEYVARYPGKRSLFFQFLLSVMHDLTGYRAVNALIFNGFVTLVFYSGLYTLVYQLTRMKRVAVTAIILAFGVPLLAHVATSAGYDLLNSTMLVLLCLMLFRLLRSDQYVQNQQTALIYFAVLASQVRYESLLYLLPMALIVGLHWFRVKRISVSWLEVCSPLFLILPLFLNLNMQSNPALMDDRVRAEGQAFIDASYLAENALDAFSYYFVPDLLKTNSVLVTALGAVGIVAVLVCLLSRLRHVFSGERNAHVHVVVGSMLLACIGCFLIMLSHFWGQLSDYQATRFALPMYVFGIVCFAALLEEMKIRDRILSPLLVGISLLVASSSFASSAKSHVTQSMLPSYVTEWFLEFAEEQDSRATLFITENVPSMASHGYASFPPAALAVDPTSLIRVRSHGIYERIYAIEVFGANWRDGKYTLSIDAAELPDVFIAEPVAELSFAPSYRSRIVEIVGVRLDDGRAIYFDDYELPERNFENGQEYYEYMLRQYPDAFAREADLVELGLDASE